MPGMTKFPTKAEQESTNFSISASGLGLPMKAATSRVKKSAVSTKGATVDKLI